MQVAHDLAREESRLAAELERITPLPAPETTGLPAADQPEAAVA